MSTPNDHYSPLDPSDQSTAALGSQDLVCLGPFCDEEHAREILEPLFAPSNVRIATQDDEDIGPQLFEAEVLTTSEGMWVQVEAGLAGYCDEEYTEFGFQSLPTLAEDDEYGPPVSFRIRPLTSVDGALHAKAAIAEHPNSGPGNPADGAKAELLVRGNTDSCKTERWLVELRDTLGDQDLNEALYQVLRAKEHSVSGAPGVWIFKVPGAGMFGPFEDAERDRLLAAYAEVRAAHPPAWAG